MQYSALYTSQEKGLVYSMMLSSILPLLDGSIINVVLPDIAISTGTSPENIQWAITAYMLACSAGVLLSPLLSKKIGVKTLWFYSMLIFVMGSVLVGLSTNLVTLVASRSVQGAGAGILIPVCQTVIAISFGKERIKHVMALIAVPAVFAPALGPLLGAVLSDSLSWRAAFFINVPLVILALLTGRKVVPQSEKVAERINYPIFLLFFISLVMILISIKGVLSGAGIDNVYTVVLPVGLSCLILSIGLNNRSANSIINLHQLKRRKYALAILMGFLTSIIFFGFLIFFPLAKSGEGDISLTCIGGLLAIQGIGAWAARKFIYQKLSHLDPFLIAGSSIVVSAFSLLLIEHGDPFFEIVGFIVRGTGLGIATILALSSPFEFGEREYIHDTSAIIRVVQQIGGAGGGLLAGALIHLVGQKSISLYGAYQALFFISLFIGVFLIVICLLLSQSACGDKHGL